MDNFLHRVVFFDLGQTLVITAARRMVPGAAAALSQLRAAGVRLGIISNTGNLTRAQLLAALPTDFDLDAFEPALVLLSSEVGIEKPNPAMFSLAAGRAGVPARACLYCSEDLLETLAAQGAGMTAARLTPAPQSDLPSLVGVLRGLAELPH